MTESQAQVNQSFNFIGKVSNTDGSELLDGAYDFDFVLYNQPTGGSALWSESLTAATSFAATIGSSVVGSSTVTYTYAAESATTTLRVGQYLSNASDESALIADFDTAANTVTVVATSAWADADAIVNRPYVEGGVIDVDLGTVTSLSGLDFDQTLYLQITFAGELMQPRKTIESVLQAFNADTLDGLHASDFARLGEDATVTGEWTFNNIVSIASSTNQSVLTVNQSGAGDIVDFQVSGVTAFAVNNDGRVQIGDYYFPTTHGASGYVLKTDAAGDMYWDVDFAGAGGGSGLWASSTNNDLIRQADTGMAVVIGNTATTAPLAISLEVDGFAWFDSLGISNQQGVRFYDADSSNYISIRATTTMSSDVVLTLPADAGTFGNALITDGNGNLTWGSPSGNGLVNTSDLAGQIPFYAAVSNELSATSTIFIDPNNSFVGIGTTAPTNQLSVKGTADFDELCFGGSCITSWSGAGSIDGSGTGGYITIWQDADTISSEQYLAPARGGIGQNFSAETGFVYFNAGTASASSSISIGMTDLAAGTGLSFIGNVITIDAGGDWTGSFDGQDGTYYLDAINLNNFIVPFASALSGTTTDALSEGTTNLYWSNSRFDTRLSATTTLGNITTLDSLQTIGTITSGTWNGDILAVDYGGTGADSSGWTGIAMINSGVWGASSTLGTSVGGTGINSYVGGDILYADASGVLTKLPVGSESDILVVSNSGIPDWVATTSLGLDIQNMTGVLDTEHGGTGQDFSGATGFVYLDGGIANASSTISIAHTDLAVSTGLTLTNNLLALNTSGNWTGTFDGLEGTDFFSLADWYATTSAPQITALINLDSVGTITAGDWQASVVDVPYGGTGKSSWTVNSIPFMTNATTFGEIAIGAATYVLAVNAAGDGYEWINASSTGTVLSQEQVDDYVNALLNDTDAVHSLITVTYDDANDAMDFEVESDLALYSNSNAQFFSTTTDILAADFGGTGTSSSAWTGVAYVNSGVWTSSSTLSAVNLDSVVMIQNENISLLNNDAGYITDGNTNWDNSYNLITLTDLSATAPVAYDSGTGVFSMAAANGSTNGYLASADFTTFNSKQNALTLGNLTENNSNVLTITNGTGAVIGAGLTIEVDTDLDNYDNTTSSFITLANISATSPVAYDSGTGVVSLGVVPVASGGLGTTTVEVNSILYASAADTISEILAGGNGDVLKMVGGVPVWAEDSVGTLISPWASSSDQLLIHPNPDTQVVLVGASATSSTGFIFEVAGNSLFGGSISAQDLSLINALSVADGGTGSSSPSGLLYGDGAGNIVSITNNSANWNTAFSWSNHADANYFSTTTDTLLVAYGGTGKTTWAANSLVYADSLNSLGEIVAGSEGEALIMQGGIPTWSSTSPGTAHGLLSVMHTGVEATSTQVRGDILTVNSANNYSRMALGASGYILRSNGLDASWVPTVNITELGTITAGTWEGDVIGVAYGGTGSSTAAGARENLDLDEIYDFAINSTATSGWIWMSDGAGRGSWLASTTLMGDVDVGDKVSKFLATTTALFDGSFLSGGFKGYGAANDACNSEFTGAHYCRVYDILVTVEQDDISTWGASAWVAEGPPGYTSNSNDCQGWTSNSGSHMGAFWSFDSDGGGMGWLTNCSVSKPLACCAR